ncbi:GNAT family N-acetyltransferase [Patulibacter sp.]|uniref:GNAT family N-acetyltransferase n=1 Tax=Patulibacter sp. TaxID=1912859 RepID=UPI00271E4AF5|nr:GNAT family N-acetyltransferase [Patulibacter sp.]MDO9409900.1 GNAT family N-acetyltransferase [Patulibacter sp.]
MEREPDAAPVAGAPHPGDPAGPRRSRVELVTDRLRMRAWRAGDRAPFAAMNADPRVMRHIGSGPLDAVGSDGLRSRLRSEWSRAGHGLWALERRDDGAFAGFCGLTAVPFGTRGTAGALEVGWRLPRAQWGHGFATEAARAALDVAWSALGVASVVALVHPDNARSLAVGERLGMRVVGTTLHPPTGWRVLVLRADRPDDVDASFQHDLPNVRADPPPRRGSPHEPG